MGNLIKINSSVIVKDQKNMDEYLKPLSRDIFLFKTKIGSTYKLKDKNPLMKLKINDELSFRIGESKYEDNQINIYNSFNELVGFVPEADSIIFSRLMSAGKMLFAIIKNISYSHEIPLIDIDIYLKDF